MIFDEYADRIPEREDLRRLAMRQVADDGFWEANRAFERGNAVACQELLNFAADVHPPLRKGRAWRGLWWKRILGPRAWATLRPVVQYLRGIFAGSTKRAG